MGLIDPRDVIENTSIEQLNSAAEEYFAAIADRTHLFAKPFSGLRESPDLLISLGLLIQGLRLGVSMTVLELAAGSCWLSRYLAELRCAVIACDVSPTALRIGRELFEQRPLLQAPVRPPVFLLTDGLRLDLPDASVDRVVINDGFHHIPNVEQVIAEIFRVLRPGGIAGFSEPGRFHSQTSQSQEEMRQFAVLENDIDLDFIWSAAQSAGFTELSAPVMSLASVDQGQHQSIVNDRMSLEVSQKILRGCIQLMTNKTIFFLHKGEFVFDSRSAEGLGHRIELLNVTSRRQERLLLSVSLRLHNVGSSIWLSSNIVESGVVRLGGAGCWP